MSFEINEKKIIKISKKFTSKKEEHNPKHGNNTISRSILTRRNI